MQITDWLTVGNEILNFAQPYEDLYSADRGQI